MDSEPWLYTFVLTNGESHSYMSDSSRDDVIAVTKYVVHALLNEKQPITLKDGTIIRPEEFSHFTAMRYSDFLKTKALHEVSLN